MPSHNLFKRERERVRESEKEREREREGETHTQTARFHYWNNAEYCHLLVKIGNVKYGRIRDILCKRDADGID